MKLFRKLDLEFLFIVAVPVAGMLAAVVGA